MDRPILLLVEAAAVSASFNRSPGDHTMTTSRLFSCLTHAAALVGLLLVASAAHSAAAGAGAVRSASTGANKAAPSAAVIRDHRKLVRDHRGVTRKHPGRRTICAGWAC
jgi:hypothetical protein